MVRIIYCEGKTLFLLCDAVFFHFYIYIGQGWLLDKGYGRIVNSTGILRKLERK